MSLVQRIRSAFRSDVPSGVPRVVSIGSVASTYSNILVLQLKDEGIHAVAEDESGFPRSSGIGFRPQSRILVREDQAERATVILEENSIGW